LGELLTHEETGGSVVDSYKVELDDSDTASWTNTHDSLVLDVELSGLTVSTTYLLRASAQSVHGWGANSDTLTVVSSAVPNQPLAVTSEIVNLDVKLNWQAPESNFAAITSYVTRI
jgi:hypothetical protein